jgi:dTDP-4-amino-4,6-dideoxygalactose transaminase
MLAIPYGRQDVAADDIEAVVEVLRSDWLTQGPTVPRFETALAAYCGARQAVAVNSATAALHIACRALGLGAGDRLWTSPNTFVASANCALYCGAEVDFVDIDPRTYNMNVDALAESSKPQKQTGGCRRSWCPCISAVNPATWPASARSRSATASASSRMRPMQWAANISGAAVGNCRYSDIAVFSFHPVKLITTGEGGAALTNDPELAECGWHACAATASPRIRGACRASPTGRGPTRRSSSAGTIA